MIEYLSNNLEQKYDYLVLDKRDGNQSIQRGVQHSVPNWAGNPIPDDSVVNIPNNNLIALLHWNANTDLDLSSISYDENGKCIGWCSFTNKIGSNGELHSGDVINPLKDKKQSDKFNATERIIFPSFEEYKKNNVKWVVLCVYSYSNKDFSTIDEATLAIGNNNNDNNGLGPLGISIITSSRLHGSSKMNVSCIMDVDNEQLFMCNINIPKKIKITSNSVESSKNIIWDITKNYMKMYEQRKPLTYDFIGNILKLAYNKVVVLDKNSSKYFNTQQTDESKVDTDTLDIPQEIFDIIEENKEENKDKPSILWIGGKVPDTLEKNSSFSGTFNSSNKCQLIDIISLLNKKK